MRFCSIFFLVLFIVSCQNIERPEKPENLIDKEELKDILYDVSIINAARDVSRAQLKMAGISPDSFIYKKYNIDSAQFAQSVAYYSVDFNTNLKIWEDVNTRLEDKRDETDSLIRRRDSIKAEERRLKNDSLGKEEEPRRGLMDPDELKRAENQ